MSEPAADPIASIADAIALGLTAPVEEVRQRFHGEAFRELTEARARIAAALAVLDTVPDGVWRTHSDECYRWHAGCLAAVVRKALEGDRDGD